MVVFTCNHCGDSIQKPKVEKHISLECKKKFHNPSLCCIDCLKDFNVKTYVEHIQCVSEAERYSAKGFVPKASSNKGEKRQTSWIEVIPTILQKQGITNDQRKILQQLSNYSNVPRKRTKFLNFIKNSLKWTNKYPDAVTSVFDLIETEFKASQSQSQTNIEKEKAESLKVSKNGEKTKSQKPAKNEEKVELQETQKNVEIPKEVTIDQEGEFEVVKKKKNKNKESKQEKHQEVVPQAVEKRPIENDFEDYGGKELSKKKQKKLKIKNILENEVENSIVEENSPPQESVPVAVAEQESGTVDITNLSKKEKKELKKKMKYETELKTISLNNNEEMNDQENQEDNIKRNKKKKRKLAQHEKENDEVAVKKSKVEEPIIETSLKFDWEKVIRTLLEKAHGNEMSLKKLAKKTVTEYQAFYDSQKPYEDIEKRFHKKVNKLPFLKIFKEKVKLYTA